MQYPETMYAYPRMEGPNTGKQGAKDNLLIGFFPYPETEPETEHLFANFFRAIAFTYELEMILVSDIDELQKLDDRPIISIEENRGYLNSIDYQFYEYPEKAIYVVGSSKYQYPSDHLDVHASIYIDIPCADFGALYGAQAATIVMQHRYETWK